MIELQSLAFVNGHYLHGVDFFERIGYVAYSRIVVAEASIRFFLRCELIDKIRRIFSVRIRLPRRFEQQIVLFGKEAHRTVQHRFIAVAHIVPQRIERFRERFGEHALLMRFKKIGCADIALSFDRPLGKYIDDFFIIRKRGEHEIFTAIIRRGCQNDFHIVFGKACEGRTQKCRKGIHIRRINAESEERVYIVCRSIGKEVDLAVNHVRNVKPFEPALQIISVRARPVEYDKRRVRLPRFVHFSNFFRDVIRELFLHVGHETRFLFESVIVFIVRQKREVRSDIRFIERNRSFAFVSAFIDMAGDGIFRVQRFIGGARHLQKERGCAVFVHVIIA